ncbi:MAG TPA: thioredoxin domain-containing protein [Candidatus Sulfomarinibacteraceae bacterium]|nr:thioredoxin domain-containing protein [Candidatus Sulfomarinibacteraceae bacterium]
MKLRSTVLGMMAGLLAAAWVGAAATEDPPAEQDPAVLRFVERSVAWYPDSSYRVLSDERRQTPSGSYRVVTVERDCASNILSGQPTVVIDEVTGLAYLGSVGQLPFEQSGASARTLRPFVEGFLPEVLLRNMDMRVRVSWDLPEGTRSGAVIPFQLIVDTGYGEYAKPVAMTSDGKLLVMGAGMPLEGDPVALRRQLFAASEVVTWDRGGDAAAVDIVEFSDLECPACKSRWPLIEEVLEGHQGGLRHGMVSFPLTSIHPWAFRASSASWCVAEQDPKQLVDFKTLFYDLQRDMAVSLVTPTSLDFVAGQGLDEDAFRACYLRDRSLQAVHAQLALGHRVGVLATPTYFVNGWMVQIPEPEWFPDLVSRLAAGKEP